MRVFYNGFNLHRQFPNGDNIVESFIDHVYRDLEAMEVSYHYVVLLVADVLVVKGAKNATLNFEEKILQIACSEDKILALLANGDLIKITEAATKVPKMIDSDDDISGISMGSKLVVAQTKKGLLYNLPHKLEFRGEGITQMEAGREHCLILDGRGNVYSFGRGSRGQLGHGSLDDESEPKLIEALGGIIVERIAAGGWHSCALSRDGDLYVWGWNGSGQLGLGELTGVMATPQVLDFDCDIAEVSCGNKHTVVLTNERKLYGCGWNKYKQMKNDPRESLSEMEYLWDFSKETVKGVRCGPWNTVVLCE